MITHSSKKIYIIGSNPDDFFDLTVEAVNIFSQSDLIIFSKKFNSQYKVFFKKNNKKVFFVEDLADSKIKLVKVFLTNRNKNSSVSFFYPKTKNDCKKIPNIRNFEKLIIKVSVELVIQSLKNLLLKKLDKKYKYKVFANAKEIKLNKSLKLDKSINDVYIILENA